jgi:hypothetical protein
MKLKQLFLAIFATSVLFVSCSKDDVYEPVKETSIESTQGQDLRTMSTSPMVSTAGPKAYIFVEPQSKISMIVNHLKTTPRNPQSTGVRFYGFFTGIGIFNYNFSDLQNYVDMPHWSDGRLPAIIQSDITQNPTTGLYNFGTVKISGPLVHNQFVWIIVLIPVNATPLSTWRQSQMSTAHSNMTYRTPFNTNSTLSNYILNYTGTRIPAGQYRVYSTYSGTELRPKVMGDFYVRGNNQLPKKK